MPRNKIISQKVKPFIIGLSAFTVVGLGTIFTVNQNPQWFNQKNENNPLYMFNVISFGAMIYLLVCTLVPLYKTTNDFASESAINYVKKVMEKNPELKRFQPVLQDSAAMRRIATLISNDLRPDEQKLVLKLIGEIKLDSSIEYIDEIHNKITKVVEEHIKTNPELSERLYIALTSADYAQYVKQKQQENMALAKQPKTK